METSGNESPREAVIDLNGPKPIDLVTSVLETLSLCMECIVLKSGLSREDAIVALKVLLRTHALDPDAGQCDSCGGPGALRRQPAA